MSKEALKLALEWFEKDGEPDHHPVVTAIKEALAEPEQHQNWCASLTQLLMSMPPKPAPCNCKPPQRTWVELSDEEIEARAINFYNPEMYKRAVLWAQEKLKEKNQ